MRLLGKLKFAAGQLAPRLFQPLSLSLQCLRSKNLLRARLRNYLQQIRKNAIGRDWVMTSTPKTHWAGT